MTVNCPARASMTAWSHSKLHRGINTAEPLPCTSTAREPSWLPWRSMGEFTSPPCGSACVDLSVSSPGLARLVRRDETRVHDCAPLPTRRPPGSRSLAGPWTVRQVLPRSFLPRYEHYPRRGTKTQIMPIHCLMPALDRLTDELAALVGC